MTVRHDRWQPFIERYAKETWRAPVFRDVILEEIRGCKERGLSPTVLDIGCGKGFDDAPELQRSLAEASGRYLGIEPDPDILLENHFTQTFRCLFEDAPLAPDSIDIAFSVMVMEHIEHPQLFWDRLYGALKKGGVFWGFTVDARNPFVFFSLAMERLNIKDWYIRKLRKQEAERYENYGVHYRSNSPDTVRAFARQFSRVEFPPFRSKETFAYYLPRGLRWVGLTWNAISGALKLPGSILIMRVEK